jgi:5-methylthioadenosine/S-adenosylhomocysteine deaminase
LRPSLAGSFLEVKSRTWSRRDAEEKASLILEILEALGSKQAEPVRQDYPDLED